MHGDGRAGASGVGAAASGACVTPQSAEAQHRSVSEHTAAPAVVVTYFIVEFYVRDDALQLYVHGVRARV